MTKEELVGLTSLRGIAAMAVVLQHFSSTVQIVCSVSIPSLVPHGYIAVDLFFVLSGYVMSYVYLDSFRQRGPAAYVPFLLKRAARLLPLNAVVVVAFLLAAHWSVSTLGTNIFFPHENTWLDIASNLVMLQGLGIGRNMNGPAWSVSVEILAYALFPLLIAMAFGSGRMALAAAFVSICGVCWVASQSPRLALLLADPLNASLRCVCQFTLGMLAYRLAQLQAVKQVMATDKAGRYVIAAICLLGLLRVDLLTVLAFPALVLVCALNQGATQRILAWPFLHLLGIVSYSLYLIHEPFRSLLLHAVRSAELAPLGAPAAMLLALFASLAMIPLAVFVHRSIEKPLSDAARRWLSAKAVRLPVAR